MRIWRALTYSHAGLTSAFRTEMAFRLEVTGAAVFAVIAVLLPASLVQTALLLGALLLVLVVELLNSAVEATVDRISLDRHELSKRAKDMGSAAVSVRRPNSASLPASRKDSEVGLDRRGQLRIRCVHPSCCR